MKTKTLFALLPLLFICAITFAQSNDTLKINDSQSDSLEFVIVAEVLAQFPGGQEACIEFIKNNIKYPEEALTKGTSGTVYVSFVVEKDGSLTEITVLRGIGSGCDEEALRIVRLMPKWIPATYQGIIVRQKLNMPIRFFLKNKKKE